VSPLVITADNAAAVQVAFDQRILEVTTKISIHTSTSEETVFVNGPVIKTHLEKTGVKLTVVDFSLASVYVLRRLQARCVAD
jgi:prolyl-tRNA synthetase